MADPPVTPRYEHAETLDGLIGFVIDDDGAEEPGRARGHLPIHPGVCQPMGIVHGGVYAALAETLASMGTARVVMRERKGAMGMSNLTTFLRPVSEGTVHASARAIHRGRTTWVWEVELRDDADRLCATSRVTIAVRER
ncbi:MAG: PaaI family thioesterase [Actinomycetota bacterium]